MRLFVCLLGAIGTMAVYVLALHSFAPNAPGWFYPMMGVPIGWMWGHINTLLE